MPETIEIEMKDVHVDVEATWTRGGSTVSLVLTGQDYTVTPHEWRHPLPNERLNVRVTIEREERT